MKKNLILSILVMTGLMLMVLGGVSATIDSLTVTYPSEEGLYLSGIRDITWNWVGDNKADIVDIVFSTDNFDSSQFVIDTDIIVSSSPFSWNTNTGTFPDGDNYKVRFIDEEGLVYDTSDFPFTIDNTPPTIDSYTIDNPIFSPNGDQVKDTVIIDLKFSEEVDYKIEIVGGSKIIKSWTGDDVTNPNEKVWHGKDNSNLPVADGVYTVKITIEDEAGNQVIDDSQTITLDTTGPTVNVLGAPVGWLVSQTSGADASINCVSGDCVESKLYISTSKIVSCLPDYDSYTETSPYTINQPSWICAAAKDEVENIGFSDSPVKFRVSTGENAIQNAIDAADAGDIIEVAAETYTEDLWIEGKNNLELKPVTGDLVIIKGKTLVDDLDIFCAEEPNIMILSDGVKIHGFTLESKDSEVGYHPVMITIGSSNVEIYDNDFKVAVGSGYGVAIVTYCDDTFCDSNLYNGNVDISGLNIYDNTFDSLSGTGEYQAIYLNPDIGPGLVTIQNNQFTGDLRRAATVERSNVLIEDNIINTNLNVVDTNQGISIVNWYGSNIENIDIIDNIVDGFSKGLNLANSYTGLLSNIEVLENTIQNSETGIYVYSSANNILVNKNVITGNIMVGVQNDDATTTIDATYNWWGDASGPSGVGLGTGDAVSINVNYYPWAEDDSFTRFYAPVLGAVGDQPVFEGSTLIITLSASDADAVDTTLSYSDNVEFGSLDNNVFTWTPTGADQGDNPVTFTVSDGDLEDSEIIIITVKNVAPEDVYAGEDQTVDEGDEVSFSGSATDAGNDELTYEWDFDSSDGIQADATGINVLHTYADNGVYTVTLTVSDVDDASASDTLTVIVDNVAPEVEASSNKDTVILDEIVTFTGNAIDPGDDVLTYLWDFGDGETSNEENPTHSYDGSGTYIVTLTVTDDDKGVGSDTLTVTVNDFVINLEQGWNLISIPVVPSSIEIGDVSIVYAYDPVNSDDGGWLLIYNEEDMTAGYGYWVYTKSATVIKGMGDLISEPNGMPTVPPSRNLVAGWNLIGHYGLTEEKEVYCSLFSLIDTMMGYPRWSALFSYDAVSDQFTSLNVKDNTNRGEGYWIEMDVEDLYGPATTCWGLS